MQAWKKRATPENIASLRSVVGIVPDEALAQLTYIERGTNPGRALAALAAFKDEVTPRLKKYKKCCLG